MATFAERVRANDPELVDLKLTEEPDAYCADMDELIDALKQNTVIQYVRFDRDFLPCMDAKHLSDFFVAIGKLPALVEAHFWHASIPVSYLAQFVTAARSLEFLEFGCLDLGGTQEDFTVISDAMKGHPALKAFTMTDFSLHDDTISMDYFVETLGTIPNLAAVKLEVIHARRQSIVGSENAAKKVSVTLTGPALATLCSSPYLQELTLNRLNLKLDDFEALATALKTAPSLRHLALPRCNLTDQSCDHLAIAIATNQTLEKLDLSCNQLTDEGCITIATALKKNTSVKLLRLWGNVKISNTGFEAIKDMLEQNVSLERVPLMAPDAYTGKIDMASLRNISASNKAA